MYTYEVKKVTDMTPAEKKVCYGMSFKHNGLMSSWLRYPYTEAKVVLVRDGDLLVGWGVRNPQGAVGFWTRRSHRRRGIGSGMVNKLKEIGITHPAPHDEPSEKFFIKNNYTVSTNYSERSNG